MDGGTVRSGQPRAGGWGTEQGSAVPFVAVVVERDRVSAAGSDLVNLDNDDRPRSWQPGRHVGQVAVVLGGPSQEGLPLTEQAYDPGRSLEGGEHERDPPVAWFVQVGDRLGPGAGQVLV